MRLMFSAAGWTSRGRTIRTTGKSCAPSAQQHGRSTSGTPDMVAVRCYAPHTTFRRSRLVSDVMPRDEANLVPAGRHRQTLTLQLLTLVQPARLSCLAAVRVTRCLEPKCGHPTESQSRFKKVPCLEGSGTHFCTDAVIF